MNFDFSINFNAYHLIFQKALGCHFTRELAEHFVATQCVCVALFYTSLLCSNWHTNITLNIKTRQKLMLHHNTTIATQNHQMMKTNKVLYWNQKSHSITSKTETNTNTNSNTKQKKTDETTKNANKHTHRHISCK